ncbi:redoxin family protein, partial [Vibrio vulnificus]|uniref:redoxin family protein n=1 Tax=Vibrio vulnificus TaxID=672 RepID=UPI001EECD81F
FPRHHLDAIRRSPFGEPDQTQFLRQWDLPSAPSPALHVRGLCWCGICRDEHRFIMSLKQQGIDVIGLNYRDNKQEALGYLESEGNPYSKVIYDPDGIVSIDFGVIGTPETYLINPNGEIMIKFRGKLDQKQWNKHFATYFK